MNKLLLTSQLQWIGIRISQLKFQLRMEDLLSKLNQEMKKSEDDW